MEITCTIKHKIVCENRIQEAKKENKTRREFTNSVFQTRGLFKTWTSTSPGKYYSKQPECLYHPQKTLYLDRSGANWIEMLQHVIGHDTTIDTARSTWSMIQHATPPVNVILHETRYCVHDETSDSTRFTTWYNTWCIEFHVINPKILQLKSFKILWYNLCYMACVWNRRWINLRVLI